MQEMISYADRLKQRLRQIEQTMMELLDVSVIERCDDSFVVGPEYRWGKTSGQQKLLQMKLLKEYRIWIEQLRLLFSSASQEISAQIDEIDEFIMSWIQKEDNWEIPATIQEAREVFRYKIQEFYNLIGLFDQVRDHSMILVPDSNVLIVEPDVSRYKEIIGMSDFVVVLLPTVLEELDKLKITHRERDFRDKVHSAIRRIKGWRNQGSLLEGVKVHKTIVVKMVATEPDFANTLSWLDPSNKDDRIIASTLELQRNNPTSVVILVTADINLQNKAEMAGIPYLDLPAEMRRSSSAKTEG